MRSRYNSFMFHSFNSSSDRVSVAGGSPFPGVVDLEEIRGRYSRRFDPILEVKF